MQNSKTSLTVTRYGRVASATLLAIVAFTGCGTEPGADDPVTQTTSGLTNDSLAFHWAPIHYQDVFKSGGTGANGHSDYIVRFNYDGDFNGRNNWDNLTNSSFANNLRGEVQYSVAETSSHWFITYMMYHPRDWAAGTADEHENDAESVVMMVRKDATTFGTLEALVTMFHEQWKSYRAQTYIGKGPCNPDTPQDIQFESGRPRTYQEPQGHGFIGCTSSSNCVRNDDGIRYVPGTAAGIPPSTIPNGTQVSVAYSLSDMGDLLSHRWDTPVFVNPSTLAGDSSGDCGAGLSTCTDNAADAVWAHSDSRIPNTPACNAIRGLSGEDWASFMGAFFTFGTHPAPATDYIQNPFLHQKCEAGRRMQGSTDSCVQSLCAADPFCCNTAWDSVCVNEVGTFCGQSCQNCTAQICTAQSGPIGDGCNSLCAHQVCASDPYCCNTAWDNICVSEVPTFCGLTCF